METRPGSFLPQHLPKSYRKKAKALYVKLAPAAQSALYASDTAAPCIF
jgi:hypothetical protein